MKVDSTTKLIKIRFLVWSSVWATLDVQLMNDLESGWNSVSFFLTLAAYAIIIMSSCELHQDTPCLSLNIRSRVCYVLRCCWTESFSGFDDIDEIKKLFPCLFGQPSAVLVPGDAGNAPQSLKVGVGLSGGQAPGGHNVISGIYGQNLFLLYIVRGNYLIHYFSNCLDLRVFCEHLTVGISMILVHGWSLVCLWKLFLDYLQDHCKGSTLYGFRGGPAGIMKCKYTVLNSEYIYPFRNQVSLNFC